MTGDAAGHEPAHLPLLLSEDGYVPLYLQLVHQIRHLITSGGLAADDRLQSVRELAQQLVVNAGTVALAYRTLQLEGLIESRRGRGTYVAAVGDGSGRFAHRQRALEEAIDSLLDRAGALGFDAATVSQYLYGRAQRPRSLPIVVVMPELRGAEKYARLVAAELPPGLTVEAHSLTLEEVENGAARVLDAYRTAFFTFTFPAHAPAVTARLLELGLDVEVVGITAQLTPATTARLRALDPAAKLALVAEARTVNVALNLMAQFSPLDLKRLTVFTELSPRADVIGADCATYIHTFGATPHLEALGIEPSRRLELNFTLSDEARARLRQLLDGVGHGALQRPPELLLDT